MVRSRESGCPPGTRQPHRLAMLRELADACEAIDRAQDVSLVLVSAEGAGLLCRLVGRRA